MGGTKKKTSFAVGFPPLGQVERGELEKRFTLDCIAIGNLSDVSRNKTNPCVQVTLPIYNPQKDDACSNYFKFKGVKKLLNRTQQSRPGTSQYGKVLETYISKSHANTYLALRNTSGAGHGVETVAGHYSSPVFQPPTRPVTTYNGKFGYRRNVPSLRVYPSSFEPPVRCTYHPNGTIFSRA